MQKIKAICIMLCLTAIFTSFCGCKLRQDITETIYISEGETIDFIEETGSTVSNGSGSSKKVSNRVIEFPTKDIKDIDTSVNDTSGTISLKHGGQNSLWYYDHLTSVQKKVYDTIYILVCNLAKGMYNVGKCTEEDLKLACKAVESDHPELFWMPPTHLIGNDKKGNFYIGFDCAYGDKSTKYLIDLADLKVCNLEMQGVLRDISKGVSEKMTEFELELYLHDWLCNNATYTEDETDDMGFTSYGALVNGRAVCQGYARCFQLLCNYYGLKCHTVCGASKGIGHMWNQAMIGGSYYNIDVTWDSTGKAGCLHSYFNLTDERIKFDHTFDKDFYSLTKDEKIGSPDAVGFNLSLPSCTDTASNYYVVNKTMLTGNKSADKSIILNSVLVAMSKNQRITEFGISDTSSVSPDKDVISDYYAVSDLLLYAAKARRIKLSSRTLYVSGKSFAVAWQ